MIERAAMMEQLAEIADDQLLKETAEAWRDEAGAQPDERPLRAREAMQERLMPGG